MKLSVNTMGMFVFTAIAMSAFFWMAKRPVKEGNIIQFGVPSQSSSAEPTMGKETPKLIEEPKKEDTVVSKEKALGEASSGTVIDESKTASEEATKDKKR